MSHTIFVQKELFWIGFCQLDKSEVNCSTDAALGLIHLIFCITFQEKYLLFFIWKAQYRYVQNHFCVFFSCQLISLSSFSSLSPASHRSTEKLLEIKKEDKKERKLANNLKAVFPKVTQLIQS